MMHELTQDFMRVSDVATLLKIQKSRAYYLISINEIPSIRVGGAIRVPRSAWDRWIVDKSEEALKSVRQTKTTPTGMGVVSNAQ